MAPAAWNSRCFAYGRYSVNRFSRFRRCFSSSSRNSSSFKLEGSGNSVDTLVKLLFRQFIEFGNSNIQLLRQDGRHDLQVLVRLLDANLVDHVSAVRREIFVHRLDESFAQLVARSFRPSRIARLELMLNRRKGRISGVPFLPRSFGFGFVVVSQLEQPCVSPRAMMALGWVWLIHSCPFGPVE